MEPIIRMSDKSTQTKADFFQLLDCFILPVVMILSYFALKIRYISVHYIGVVVALAGVGCMVGADVLVGRNDGGQSGRLSRVTNFYV